LFGIAGRRCYGLEVHVKLLLAIFCFSVCFVPAYGLDRDALDPIVIVNGNFGATPTFGAGVIFSREKDKLYIVTANHVVRGRGGAVTHLTVRLRIAPDKQLPAKLLEPFDSSLDLAVLSVENLAAQSINVCSLSLERLAPSGSAERGDSVFPVGDPNGVAWAMPVQPGAISDVSSGNIVFESSLIARGHSGGGLLDDSEQLIGLIQADEPPYGRALSFEKILQVLEGWKYETDLGTLNEDGNPPIFSAVADGKINETKHLLARACSDPNAKGKGDFPLLHYALGNLEMMKLLFAAGADVKADDFLMAESDDLNEVQLLLSHGAQCGYAPNMAARNGKTDELNVLLNRCPRMNAKRLASVLFDAIDVTRPPVAEAMVQALVQAGADVNAVNEVGLTALIMAVIRNQVGCAKLLIAGGASFEPSGIGGTALERIADFDAYRADYKDHPMAVLLAGSSNRADPGGRAKLLRRAAREGWTDVAQLLIDHGLDVKGDSGADSLVTAVRYQQAEVSILLLRSGANPNAPTGSGHTALEWVLSDWMHISDRKLMQLRLELVKTMEERGATVREDWNPLQFPLFSWQPADLEVAAVLVAHGADVNGRFGNEGTYLDYARAHHMQDVVDFLLKQGAKDVDAGH
jgi:ankyrin repeat protein